MSFSLPKLPYELDALAPHISKETLEYHYLKHHQAYVNKLNLLTDGSDHANKTLEEVIKSSDGAIFNNAAQVWNHSFYWQCLQGSGTQSPQADMLAAIEKKYGSYEEFKSQFTQAALGQFGSGWAWLVKNNDGSIDITTTSNAENPITEGLTPILTCDVWEHAYYIDTRNDRGKYLANFWELVNWEFVSQNYSNL